MLFSYDRFIIASDDYKIHVYSSTTDEGQLTLKGLRDLAAYSPQLFPPSTTPL
jgi:hypothetical protein